MRKYLHHLRLVWGWRPNATGKFAQDCWLKDGRVTHAVARSGRTWTVQSMAGTFFTVTSDDINGFATVHDYGY